jgi:two-component system, NarL family, response regulator LiaR
MPPIRVMIVDDHELVRRGLRAVLEAQDDLEVVGEASNGDRAVPVAEETQPDVMLLDMRMPGMGGVEVCQAVRQCCPDTAVLVLTSFDDDDDVFGVLSAGASGYILKDISPDSLVQSIRAAADGQTVLDSSVARRVIDGRKDGEECEPAEPLSEREQEVLDLMALGLANRQIAQRLWISEATVKTHVTHILRKLGQPDRTSAVLHAMRCGLVQPR